ncbi:hypothetical protein RIF29_26940 [Crotalaria pallida]|uniref:Uncharacterized protein n=1 Tax=Crotalaria pallida TaxID=3830 RepID=A0AAN9EQL6_CROPI
MNGEAHNSSLSRDFIDAIRSTAPEDKYSLVEQFDGIRNQRETAESIKLGCGLNQHLQCFEDTAKAEDKHKEDKTTHIMITSTRTEEDKNSAESSSPDKIVKQPPCQISENEGIQSKDFEIGSHVREIINNINIEEYDHDIGNELKVSTLACAEEPNIKVHEQESSRDNSDKPMHGKTEDSSTPNVAENRDEETTSKASLKNGYDDSDKFESPSFNQATDGASTEEVEIEGDTPKDISESASKETPAIPIDGIEKEEYLVGRNGGRENAEKTSEMGLAMAVENRKIDPEKHDGDEKDSLKKSEPEGKLGDHVILIP